ncbi:hypothetical protein T265_09026 [Opisthorchis viverrini]|uniref:Uncharacterized protein n=1 Tax=Opisthorchis viverrini TaxID=6198 RepID=A0A074ZBK5_OPIVI|nr:hypothetical protein T265_09026 [Opisthorchis viverrini]KER22982.1 hypothetical protein T265_09026 [Opisthorchis viverrini]
MAVEALFTASRVAGVFNKEKGAITRLPSVMWGWPNPDPKPTTNQLLRSWRIKPPESNGYVVIAGHLFSVVCDVIGLVE